MKFRPRLWNFISEPSVPSNPIQASTVRVRRSRYVASPRDRGERLETVVGALVPTLASSRGEGAPILIDGDASRNFLKQGGLSQANPTLRFAKN